MSEQYTNRSGKYRVFVNKVDPSIAWVCEPGYSGIVENDVIAGEYSTRQEAQRLADELWWQNTTEENRERYGSFEDYIEYMKEERLDSIYIQLNQWVRDIYDWTGNDPKDWPTVQDWAKAEVSYWKQRTHTPTWFDEHYQQYMVQRLVKYAGTAK